MRSNYKRLGDYIREVDVRNVNDDISTLLGINIDKYYMPSVANVVGTDLSRYKIVNKGQFACNRMHVGRDKRLPVALSTKDESFIVSPAYDVFEIIDSQKLLPDYLMMWFSRSEFDRNTWFYTDADVRGGLSWNTFSDMLLPVPSPEKQREIVVEYNAIQKRIDLNNQLIQKLEETAQAIYKQWFVNEVDIENLPKGWRIEKLERFTKMRYGKMLDSELFLEKGYPVFSGYGVRGYYSEYMYEEPQILVLCRGVSGTGEVRLSPRFSFITNLSIVVEVNNPSISRMYLYYYLKNSDLKSLDSGSAQSMITTGDLYFQEALLPPSDLQMKFDEFANTIMREIEVYNQENQKLSELKELLLSKLSTIEI
jgi:type I restriction enzyme S subunit